MIKVLLMLLISFSCLYSSLANDKGPGLDDAFSEIGSFGVKPQNDLGKNKTSKNAKAKPVEPKVATTIPSSLIDNSIQEISSALEEFSETFSNDSLDLSEPQRETNDSVGQKIVEDMLARRYEVVSGRLAEFLVGDAHKELRSLIERIVDDIHLPGDMPLNKIIITSDPIPKLNLVSNNINSAIIERYNKGAKSYASLLEIKTGSFYEKNPPDPKIVAQYEVDIESANQLYPWLSHYIEGLDPKAPKVLLIENIPKNNQNILTISAGLLAFMENTDELAAHIAKAYAAQNPLFYGEKIDPTFLAELEKRNVYKQLKEKFKAEVKMELSTVERLISAGRKPIALREFDMRLMRFIEMQNGKKVMGVAPADLLNESEEIQKFRPIRATIIKEYMVYKQDNYSLSQLMIRSENGAAAFPLEVQEAIRRMRVFSKPFLSKETYVVTGTGVAGATIYTGYDMIATALEPVVSPAVSYISNLWSSGTTIGNEVGGTLLPALASAPWEYVFAGSLLGYIGYRGVKAKNTILSSLEKMKDKWKRNQEARRDSQLQKIKLAQFIKEKKNRASREKKIRRESPNFISPFEVIKESDVKSFKGDTIEIDESGEIISMVSMSDKIASANKEPRHLPNVYVAAKALCLRSLGVSFRLFSGWKNGCWYAKENKSLNNDSRPSNLPQNRVSIWRETKKIGSTSKELVVTSIVNSAHKIQWLYQRTGDMIVLRSKNSAKYFVLQADKTQKMATHIKDSVVASYPVVLKVGRDSAISTQKWIGTSIVKMADGSKQSANAMIMYVDEKNKQSQAWVVDTSHELIDGMKEKITNYQAKVEIRKKLFELIEDKKDKGDAIILATIVSEIMAGWGKKISIPLNIEKNIEASLDPEHQKYTTEFGFNKLDFWRFQQGALESFLKCLSQKCITWTEIGEIELPEFGRPEVIRLLANNNYSKFIRNFYAQAQATFGKDLEDVIDESIKNNKLPSSLIAVAVIGKLLVDLDVALASLDGKLILKAYRDFKLLGNWVSGPYIIPHNKAKIYSEAIGQYVFSPSGIDVDKEEFMSILRYYFNSYYQSNKDGFSQIFSPKVAIGIRHYLALRREDNANANENNAHRFYLIERLKDGFKSRSEHQKYVDLLINDIEESLIDRSWRDTFCTELFGRINKERGLENFLLVSEKINCGKNHNSISNINIVLTAVTKAIANQTFQVKLFKPLESYFKIAEVKKEIDSLYGFAASEGRYFVSIYVSSKKPVKDFNDLTKNLWYLGGHFFNSKYKNQVQIDRDGILSLSHLELLIKGYKSGGGYANLLDIIGLLNSNGWDRNMDFIQEDHLVQILIDKKLRDKLGLIQKHFFEDFRTIEDSRHRYLNMSVSALRKIIKSKTLEISEILEILNLEPFSRTSHIWLLNSEFLDQLNMVRTELLKSYDLTYKELEDLIFPNKGEVISNAHLFSFEKMSSSAKVISSNLIQASILMMWMNEPNPDIGKILFVLQTAQHLISGLELHSENKLYHDLNLEPLVSIIFSKDKLKEILSYSGGHDKEGYLTDKLVRLFETIAKSRLNDKTYNEKTFSQFVGENIIEVLSELGSASQIILSSHPLLHPDIYFNNSTFVGGISKKHNKMKAQFIAQTKKQLIEEVYEKYKSSGSVYDVIKYLDYLSTLGFDVNVFGDYIRESVEGMMGSQATIDSVLNLFNYEKFWTKGVYSRFSAENINRNSNDFEKPLIKLIEIKKKENPQVWQYPLSYTENFHQSIKERLVSTNNWPTDAKIKIELWKAMTARGVSSVTDSLLAEIVKMLPIEQLAEIRFLATQGRILDPTLNDKFAIKIVSELPSYMNLIKGGIHSVSGILTAARGKPSRSHRLQKKVSEKWEAKRQEDIETVLKKLTEVLPNGGIGYKKFLEDFSVDIRSTRSEADFIERYKYKITTGLNGKNETVELTDSAIDVIHGVLSNMKQKTKEEQFNFLLYLRGDIEANLAIKDMFPNVGSERVRGIYSSLPILHRTHLLDFYFEHILLSDTDLLNGYGKKYISYIVGDEKSQTGKIALQVLEGFLIGVVGAGQSEMQSTVLSYLYAMPRVSQASTGEVLKQVLESFGAIGVKLGQFLSGSGLLSREDSAILAQLQENANPLTRYEIYKDLESIFSTTDLPFDIDDLIGSASLKYAFLAKTRLSEKKLVVKVFRKEALNRLDTQILVLESMSNHLKKYGVKYRVLKSLIDATHKAVKKELEMSQEAIKGEKARTLVYVNLDDENFAVNVPNENVPPNVTRLVIAEYAEGVSFNELPDSVKPIVAQKISDMELGILFADKEEIIFDPDRHAGNYRIYIKKFDGKTHMVLEPDGSIGSGNVISPIDFGQLMSITSDTRDNIVKAMAISQLLRLFGPNEILVERVIDIFGIEDSKKEDLSALFKMYYHKNHGLGPMTTYLALLASVEEAGGVRLDYVYYDYVRGIVQLNQYEKYLPATINTPSRHLTALVKNQLVDYWNEGIQWTTKQSLMLRAYNAKSYFKSIVGDSEYQPISPTELSQDQLLDFTFSEDYGFDNESSVEGSETASKSSKKEPSTCTKALLKDKEAS